MHRLALLKLLQDRFDLVRLNHFVEVLLSFSQSDDIESLLHVEQFLLAQDEFLLKFLVFLLLIRQRGFELLELQFCSFGLRNWVLELIIQLTELWEFGGVNKFKLGKFILGLEHLIPCFLQLVFEVLHLSSCLLLGCFERNCLTLHFRIETLDFLIFSYQSLLQLANLPIQLSLGLELGLQVFLLALKLNLALVEHLFQTLAFSL